MSKGILLSVDQHYFCEIDTVFNSIFPTNYQGSISGSFSTPLRLRLPLQHSLNHIAYNIEVTGLFIAVNATSGSTTAVSI